MRKYLAAVNALLLFAAIGAPAANADTYDFTVSGADTGVIDITETGGTITAISGSFDGSAINALLPLSARLGNADNLFSVTAPYLDGNGVSFSLNFSDSRGRSDVLLFSGTTPGNYLDYQQSGADTSTLIGGFIDHLTPAPTPEPSSFILGGSGVLFAMASAIRRRVKAPASTPRST